MKKKILQMLLLMSSCVSIATAEPSEPARAGDISAQRSMLLEAEEPKNLNFRKGDKISLPDLMESIAAKLQTGIRYAGPSDALLEARVDCSVEAGEMLSKVLPEQGFIQFSNRQDDEIVVTENLLRKSVGFSEDTLRKLFQAACEQVGKPDAPDFNTALRGLLMGESSASSFDNPSHKITLHYREKTLLLLASEEKIRMAVDAALKIAEGWTPSAEAQWSTASFQSAGYGAERMIAELDEKLFGGNGFDMPYKTGSNCLNYADSPERIFVSHARDGLRMAENIHSRYPSLKEPEPKPVPRLPSADVGSRPSTSVYRAAPGRRSFNSGPVRVIEVEHRDPKEIANALRLLYGRNYPVYPR